MNTKVMEIALAKYFDPCKNLIVPNVSYGMIRYECDLLLMSKSGYLTEIEIKISKQDLKKDRKKRHNHDSRKIKYLYFAIPYKLIEDKDKAGIIVVKNNLRNFNPFYKQRNICEIIRKPKILNKYKLSDKEKFKLARLGAIRVWKLKSIICKNDKSRKI